MESRCARTAAKSSTKKTISTGAVDCTGPNMEVSFGGVAESVVRSNQGVSSPSMRTEATMMRKMMTRARQSRKLGSSKVLDVSAANSLATQSIIVGVIQI